MVKIHCATTKFYPTSISYFIPFEDGEEPVVVSINDKTLFSYKMNKHGRIIKSNSEVVDILWAGEEKPIRYNK